MKSLSAKEIHEGNLMPTFKIEGHIYHLIGSLLPTIGQTSKLYRYFSFLCDQTWEPL